MSIDTDFSHESVHLGGHSSIGPSLSRGIDFHKIDLIDALVARAGLPVDTRQRPGRQAALANWSITDICREWIACGDPTPKTMRDELREPHAVRSAVSGGEADGLFAAAVESIIRTAYTEARNPLDGWTAEIDVLNFRPVKYLTLAQSSGLEPLPRGGQAGHAQINLSGEEWQVTRFAKQFAIDEQDATDDRELQGHLLAVKQMAYSARRLGPDLAFAILLENPTLAADSTPVFHADHGNLSAAALAAESLDAGLAAIASQVYTDEHDRPVHINLEAAVLIVPPSLAGLARRLVRGMETATGPSLRVVVDSRLSTTGVHNPITGIHRVGVNTNWLLAASAAETPSVIVGHLGGRVPTVRRSTLPLGQFGFAWDIKQDIGAAIVDFRGLYFSTGA